MTKVKRRRKQSNTKRLLWLLIALATCGFIAFIIFVAVLAQSLVAFGSFGDFGCLGEEPYLLEKIESRAEFKLPSSAENLFADSVAFQDCMVFVSFEMNPIDLETFLHSTYVSSLESKKGNQLTSFVNFLQNDVDWVFENNKTYLYGGGQHPEGLESQSIVIDKISNTLFKVYIVTFLM